MCAYSMVSQHFQDQFPRPSQIWPSPTQYLDIGELLRKARLYDEMTGQKDCPDPKKEQWVKELEKVMAEKFGLFPKTNV